MLHTYSILIVYILLKQFNVCALSVCLLSWPRVCYTISLTPLLSLLHQWLALWPLLWEHIHDHLSLYSFYSILNIFACIVNSAWVEYTYLHSQLLVSWVHLFLGRLSIEHNDLSHNLLLVNAHELLNFLVSIIYIKQGMLTNTIRCIDRIYYFCTCFRFYLRD